MSDKPFTLACAWCDFTTEQPDEIVLHMMTTGHGLGDQVKAGMVESGMPAELATVIGKLQRGELCMNYQPDANGECVNCDEPADAHPQRVLDDDHE
jgi:hypothetical protein